MGSWGRVLLSFCNSLYNLIIHLLSDIGNLVKLSMIMSFIKAEVVTDNMRVTSGLENTVRRHELKQLEMGSKPPPPTALKSTGTSSQNQRKKMAREMAKES